MFRKFIVFLKNFVLHRHAGAWSASATPLPSPIPAASKGGGSMPRHCETRGYTFAEINDNQVVGSVHSFELNGSTLDVNHQQTGVITVNGHVVRPNHIAARCEVCGGFSEAVVHCDRCSVCVCFKHATCVDTPSGLLCLCLKCRDAAVMRWNTWSEKPEYRFPKPPISVTKGFIPKGTIHEDADGTNH
jgi:hypothetical protein